jgi:hypothetical protein
MTTPIPATAPAAGATRSAHLVGSTPFTDADEALDIFFTRLAPHLRTIPDGETGDRQNWIQGLLDSFALHPDLEPARPGDWSDYDRTPTYRVRRGHRFSSRRLDLGYARHFEASWPRFQARREAAGDDARPDLAFQVGIPGDFDLAIFTFGNPVAALRYRSVFRNATLRDIRAIHTRAGDEVVYQVEVPAELVFLTRLPGPMLAPAARFLASGICRLAREAPEGSRWGIHLCLGDMNHRAYGRLQDVAPIVALAEAIIRGWPSGRRLEFLHAPLAAADEPPPVEATFYAPLARLATSLPAGTRFIAGIVHEERTLDEQRELLAGLDDLLGTPVDVACSCGLGRRSRDDALATIDRAAALCATPG